MDRIILLFNLIRSQCLLRPLNMALVLHPTLILHIIIYHQSDLDLDRRIPLWHHITRTALPVLINLHPYLVIPFQFDLQLLPLLTLGMIWHGHIPHVQWIVFEAVHQMAIQTVSAQYLQHLQHLLRVNLHLHDNSLTVDV